MSEEEIKLLDKIDNLPRELSLEIRGLIIAEICLREENQQLKEQIEYLRRSIERKEEDIIDLRNDNTLHSDEYVSNLEKENQQLKEKLKDSEKARKDAIKYVKKTSGYDNPYNDTFLNTYAVDNLLEILDKGE